MSGYIKFDSESYSEELHSVTESEYDEVMQVSATNDQWEGYTEWSTEEEADAWRGSKQVDGLLIKKACEHPACGHFKCERDVRIGGIAV